MIFTIDRFAAICFPLHRRDCCLPGRAKYYAATAFFLAVVKNLPAFWTRGAEYKVIAGPNSTNVMILKSNCGCPTETALLVLQLFIATGFTRYATLEYGVFQTVLGGKLAIPRQFQLSSPDNFEDFFLCTVLHIFPP